MSFRSVEPSREPRVSGRPGKAIKLTDPETMRALAHPARIALWQHLMLEGPATATECAPFAGLSPSACSYHLRQLGRFGFVEQDQAAAATGRERPWRVVVTTTTIDDLEDPVAAMAATLLDNVIQERWNEARRRYEASRDEYPSDWRQAAGGDRVILYPTPDELARLREQIRDLYRPLIRMAGEDRPAGARPVQGGLDFVPIFAPPEGPERLERPEGSAQ
jgi:Helix-turn-helix domain